MQMQMANNDQVSAKLRPRNYATIMKCDSGKDGEDNDLLHQRCEKAREDATCDSGQMVVDKSKGNAGVADSTTSSGGSAHEKGELAKARKVTCKGELELPAARKREASESSAQVGRTVHKSARLVHLPHSLDAANQEQPFLRTSGLI